MKLMRGALCSCPQIVVQIGTLRADEVSVSSLGFSKPWFTALTPHPFDNLFINLWAFPRRKARHWCLANICPFYHTVCEGEFIYLADGLSSTILMNRI